MSEFPPQPQPQAGFPPQPEAYQAFPPVAEPPRAGGRGRRLVVVGLLAVLVIALPIIAVLAAGLLHGAGDKHEGMTPATADVYAAAFLDPSAGQKKNLLDLAHRFPGATTSTDLDKKIADSLDKALTSVNLSYNNDVKPWLGSQISFELSFPKGSDPTGAVMLDTKDESATLKAADKARAKSTDITWSQRTHDGVAEWIGKPTSGTGASSGYAVFNHTLVIGDQAGIDKVIDTAHGHNAAIKTSTDYKNTLAKVPADRLAVLYVNSRALISRYKDTLTQGLSSASGTLGQSYTDQLQKSIDAVGSGAVAVVAQPNGLEVDGALAIDSSKLDPATRAVLTGPSRASTTVAWVPATTYGFVAASNIKVSLQQAISMLSDSTPDVKQALDAFGLTGTSGVVNHLTGDAAVEVDAGATKLPDGALLLGTDDSAGMNTFLTRVQTLALSSFGTCPPTVVKGRIVHPTTCASLPQAVTTSHGGATIHSVKLPAAMNIPFSPAWTVTGGMAIVGASPEEVGRVIDAHTNANGVATTQLYKDSVGDATYQGLEYFDIQRIIAAVDANLPADALGPFDTEVKPYLAPVKAVAVISQSDPSTVKQRWFALIR
ncbi:MAG TPA: DUF3352 domain-containing protein [Candidatus Dormibacteraeota bacterium]|jgi:hypothetical protein|nr:DUF3352 domain-containing protein [Candidatus Dormibacteraeota bacterium]